MAWNLHTFHDKVIIKLLKTHLLTFQAASTYSSQFPRCQMDLVLPDQGHIHPVCQLQTGLMFLHKFLMHTCKLSPGHRYTVCRLTNSKIVWLNNLLWKLMTISSRMSWLLCWLQDDCWMKWKHLLYQWRKAKIRYYKQNMNANIDGYKCKLGECLS